MNALNKSRQQGYWAIIFWILAILIGAIHAWTTRFAMNSDGISYLDMGDAYLRGDWKMAINSYWSPLYSWLLGLSMILIKPSAYWEFPVVHLVNFLVYIFCLGCFAFFMKEMIRYTQWQTNELTGHDVLIFPRQALLLLGYSLFIFTSLKLTTLSLVSPDMLVAAFLYLAFGLLLRIRMDSKKRVTFLLLGIVLGLGYYSKAAMFPISFIFIFVGTVMVDNLKLAISRFLIAFFAFLIVVAPFLILISDSKDRLTFGDSAKLTYSWHVNGGSNVYFHGEPSTDYVHPTKKLMDKPAIYEFATPIGGTYPLWYDPSYWNEGTSSYFDFSAQIDQIIVNLKYYARMFYPDQNFLMLGFLILFVVSFHRWASIKHIVDNWFLFVPVISVLGMYMLVLVDSRYVGVFITVLWIGLFSSIRLPDTKKSKKLFLCVVAIIAAVFMIKISYCTLSKSCPIPVEQRTTFANHWQIAQGLKKMGLDPGDEVGIIGKSMGAYWARLAKVKIITEIPVPDHADDFWKATPQFRSRVLKVLSTTGAKVIVTRKFTTQENMSMEGWQQIGDTGLYAYLLNSEFARKNGLRK